MAERTTRHDCIVMAKRINDEFEKAQYSFRVYVRPFVSQTMASFHSNPEDKDGIPLFKGSTGEVLDFLVAYLMGLQTGLLSEDMM